MAFTTQFALSVELTRLIPVSLAAAGATWQAAIAFARELQNSGSDMIVEEDLAELFGRMKIQENIARSFRTIVAQSSKLEVWYAGMGLVSGAGPTVTRAFTEPHYFASVIQCSLLVTNHEASSLADSLVRHFESIAEDTQNEAQIRNVPNSQSIQGMLRACEDQTFAYPWRHTLTAIATTLDLEHEQIHLTIPETILHGLLLMLPMVQTLPEQRYIIIDTPKAACAIVAWAHHVLGIPMAVRIYEGDEYREIRFPADLPANKESILLNEGIRHSDVTESSITLLSSSSKDELFTLKADPYEAVIDSTYKGPVRGVAHRNLRLAIPRCAARERIIKEMMAITCAFSFCLAEKLVAVQPEGLPYTGREEPPDEDLDSDGDIWPLPYKIDSDRIMNAALLLFDTGERSLSDRLVREYAHLFSGQKFHSMQQPPQSLAIIFRELQVDIDPDRLWRELRASAVQFGMIIMAFAHVSDLQVCSEMQICERINVTVAARLHRLIMEWDGKNGIPVNSATVWFEIIVLLMVGYTHFDVELDDTSLIGNRGWSVYLNSFGDADPYYVGMGEISIRPGIPWRNGIWRHRVRDGPAGPLLGEWRQVASAGDTVRLFDAVKVQMGKALIGTRDDCMVLSLRLMSEAYDTPADDMLSQQPTDSSTTLTAPKYNLYRTGYAQLFSSNWLTIRTTPCQHAVVLNQEILQLQPGWCALQAFGDAGFDADPADYRLCLTAGNIAARWLTLLSISRTDKTHSGIMIRGRDCCFECAIAQTVGRAGYWYVVL